MKRLFVLFLILTAIAEFFILPGCANIVPPQGGPRDSLPPVLLKVDPADSSRNYEGNRIVFTFDEFIDVQNIQEQLLMSPSPAINPDVKFRLNTLTIRLKDTLEPNTTYSLQFGNAIRDFTEGNPARDFKYTFSTGPYIDSLELRGNVILAETGKLDTTLIVILHTNPNDSAVVRDRPRYVAKLDSKGEFVFKNLPPRTFYLYALKDDGGTRRYFNDRQLFAFADKPVVMQGEMPPVTLYAYSVKPPPIAGVSAITVSGRRTGGGQTADTRLKFQTNLVSEQQDLLTDLEMRFEQPLRSFDSSLIRLYSDSTYNPENAAISLDSTRKKIVLKTSWKENTKYHLVLNRDFADDSTGKKLLKTDTLSFTTRKLADYGSLKLKLRNLDLAKNPVLQLVLDNKIYKSAPLTSNEFSQQMFPPGEYEIRILYDDNRNGAWDPGVFFGLHKQPEIVKPVERKIIVKPNWQNDFEIGL